MPSPWVRRQLAEGDKVGHRATTPVEPTLGDRIPADYVRITDNLPREYHERDLEEVREAWAKGATK